MNTLKEIAFQMFFPELFVYRCSNLYCCLLEALKSGMWDFLWLSSLVL